MKTTSKLFSGLILALGLTLSGCSSDNGEGPQPPAEPKGKGFFSARLATGTALNMSRTDDDANAIAAEQIVKSGRWLFYTKTGDLKYSMPLYLDNNDGETDFDADPSNSVSDVSPNSPIQVVVKAVEIEIDDYDMVVLLNAPNEILMRCDDPSSPTQTLAHLQEQISITDAAAVSMFTDGTNGFFMSNANGPVAVKPSNFKIDAATAEQNPVRVRVDRAVAKTVVNEKAGGPI